jgi:hypothetical protein
MHHNLGTRDESSRDIGITQISIGGAEQPLRYSQFRESFRHMAP